MTAESGPTAEVLSASSVLRHHLLVVLLAVPISLVGLVGSPPSAMLPVLLGYGLLLVSTAVAIVVRAERVALVQALPLLADLVAVALLGAGRHTMATWIVVVLPVVWLSRSGTLKATVAPMVLATLSIGGSAAWAIAADDAPSRVTATIGLASLAVAGTVALLISRSQAAALAHAELLQRQITGLTSALQQVQQQVQRRGAEVTEVLATPSVAAERATVQARDDMIASLSHQLRTPLSSILGYLELCLEDASLAEWHRDSLGIALKNTNRVLGVVADLGQARSETAGVGLALTIGQCDLSHVLASSLEAVRPLAADRIITVSVDAPQELVIDGDPFRLRNVLDNLLANAVQYNERGGWIDITLSTVDKTALLSLTNTGNTLTEEEQSRLFDRFYRSEAARGSTTHGTGIGLSVAREIVQLHGGTLAVSSSPDLGTTTFTVILPVYETVRAGAIA